MTPCNLFLNHGSYDLWLISGLFQRLDNLLLVIGTKTLQCNPKFNCGIPVRGNKLIVFEFDDISLLFCQCLGNFRQFSRLIRKQYRNGKDTVTENQSLLYHRGHRDHIHYLNGIPADSRVNTDGRFLKKEQFTDSKIHQIQALNEIAKQRGESLAQMALKWVLKDDVVTSVLIGASKPQQILDNIKVIESAGFTDEEIRKIDEISGN